MAVSYPDYPDKAWDDDRVQYALDLRDRGELRQAMAVAGSVRHPNRRGMLQDHLDALFEDAGLAPHPSPPPAPVRVKPKPNRAGKKKGPDQEDGIVWR